jgi:hypothetical protein
MNIKQAIAATLLLVPMATTSLATKPASAHEVVTRRGNDHRILIVERIRHRRIWIGGQFDFDRFGRRYWVPGHFELRDERY